MRSFFDSYNELNRAVNKLIEKNNLKGEFTFENKKR